MSKKNFQIFTLAAFIILSMFILPAQSMAQRDNNRNDDRNYDRNNRDNRDNRDSRYNRDNRDSRYNRDNDRDDSSRYERRYSKRQLADLLGRIETSSSRFRRDLDRDLDKSRLNGSRREDNINIDVKKFEDAFIELRREFDRNERWWETRKNVETSLEAARPVATRLRNNRISANVQNQWRNLRRDLNQLATRYNLPQIS